MGVPGGSWVAIGGVIGTATMIIIYIRGVITPLSTTLDDNLKLIETLKEP